MTEAKPHRADQTAMVVCTKQRRRRKGVKAVRIFAARIFEGISHRRVSTISQARRVAKLGFGIQHPEFE